MAKHKAATEITIIQEERSAFAETVDKYKWHGIAAMVVIGAIIVWRQRAGVAAVQFERADWAELYKAQITTDGRGDALDAAIKNITDRTVASWANVDKAMLQIEDRDFGAAASSISQAAGEGADILTKMTFPIGEDGAEATLAASMEARIKAEQTFFDNDFVYSNPALPENSPHVEFETNKGLIVVGLYLDRAPQHVKNMLKLVEEDYYDGIGFHRVGAGSFIQGGDPNSREEDSSTWGLGGPGYTVPEEKNGLKHVKGALAGARSPGAKASSGSQFFITAQPMHATWDGNYTVYGQVVDGLDIVEEISNSEVQPDSDGKVVEPIRIIEARVQE